ncbi:hypothetical protein DHL47_08260, partial [Streptococcus panodentis]
DYLFKAKGNGCFLVVAFFEAFLSQPLFRTWLQDWFYCFILNDAHQQIRKPAAVCSIFPRV